jgi:hypothetical protein
MRRSHYPFKGAFLDSYSVGFCLYQPDAINWRHRTIAGVSWNGEEQEAFFFNPDGLALPLKPNPWKLPELFREKTVSREFSSIHGTGHFAMKKGRRAALKSLGLADWVTYWLVDQSADYANDPTVWRHITEQDLVEEKTASERLHRELKLTSDLSGYVAECLAQQRELLAVEHRRQCNQDSKILAWLKGETPPLLFTSMQEAA